MIHVGGYHEYHGGVFSTVGYSNNKRFYPHGTEHPHGTQDIPHGTHDILPTVLNTPTILKNPPRY